MLCIQFMFPCFFFQSCSSLLCIFIVSYQAISGHLGAAVGSHIKDLPRSPHFAPNIGFPLKVFLFLFQRYTHSLIYTIKLL